MESAPISIPQSRARERHCKFCIDVAETTCYQCSAPVCGVHNMLLFDERHNSYVYCETCHLAAETTCDRCDEPDSDNNCFVCPFTLCDSCAVRCSGSGCCDKRTFCEPCATAVLNRCTICKKIVCETYEFNCCHDVSLKGACQACVELVLIECEGCHMFGCIKCTPILCNICRTRTCTNCAGLLAHKCFNNECTTQMCKNCALSCNVCSRDYCDKHASGGCTQECKKAAVK